MDFVNPLTGIRFHGIIERMFDQGPALRSEVVEIALTAVEYARDEDLGEFEDQLLTADYERLRTAIEQLEVQANRRLMEIDRRKAYGRDGYTSTVAYLKHRCKTAGGRAMRDVGDARTLDTMSTTRELAENGRLTRDQVRALISAKQAAPDHFDDAEDMLCDIALEMPWVSGLKKATEYWKHSTESLDSHMTIKEQQDRSYLFISQTFEGMVKLDGLFDAERGNQIIGAVRAATPVPIEGERSTPASRRATALSDLISSSGNQLNKPTVLVHVDEDTFKGTAHTLAEIGKAVLTPDQIQQICCDANFRRIVLGPQSEVVDVGRKKRLLSELIRDALIARDRCCQFPGCDRPPEWCDAHHIVPWQEGGVTSASNCILLCRRHHTMIHQQGFSVEGTGHDPVFRRPDRTILQNARGKPKRSGKSDPARPQLLHTA